MKVPKATPPLPSPKEQEIVSRMLEAIQDSADVDGALAILRNRAFEGLSAGAYLVLLRKVLEEMVKTLVNLRESLARQHRSGDAGDGRAI